MAAPYPYTGVAGAVNDPAEAKAVNLFAQYSWLARLTDEMNADAQLDLKRTWQLVHHSRQFRRWRDELQAYISDGSHTQAQIATTVQGTFALRQVTWATVAAMNADLLAIYNMAGTVADWIEANAPEYKAGFSTNKELPNGDVTDEPIKATKTPAIAQHIADYRALYGPKP